MYHGDYSPVVQEDRLIYIVNCGEGKLHNSIELGDNQLSYNYLLMIFALVFVFSFQLRGYKNNFNLSFRQQYWVHRN